MQRFPTLLAGLCAGLFASPWLQDPKPPAATQPPATVPATTPTAPAPQDVPGRPTPSPLQGVYTLRARVLEGKTDRLPSLGYMAITQRHLFMCLAATGSDPSLPLVRTGVRTWKSMPEFVSATIQLGWYSDKDGGLHLERAGTEERRRIELVRGGIRVVQDERNWLEFERVE